MAPHLVRAQSTYKNTRIHSFHHTHTHTHTLQIHALLVMGGRMRRKKTTDQHAEEKRWVSSFDLKKESEDKCLTEREGKRVPDHRSDVLKGSSCLSKNKERLFVLHLWRFHKLLLQVLHAAFFSVQRQPGQQPHQASNPKQVKHPLPGQVWANLSHTHRLHFSSVCVCVIIMKSLKDLA